MATTRIYKAMIQATEAQTVLVEAANPAAVARTLAARLVTVEVAGAKDVIAAMRAGAEVLQASDDAAVDATMPLPLGAPDTGGVVVAVEGIGASAAASDASATTEPPTMEPQPENRKRSRAAA